MRSSRSPGAGCPRFPFGRTSSGPPTPPMRRTSASTRPVPPGEGIDPTAYRSASVPRASARVAPAQRGQLLVLVRVEVVEAQGLLGLLDGVAGHRDLGAGLGEAGMEPGVGRIQERGGPRAP